jgi:hypothetical protein
MASSSAADPIDPAGSGAVTFPVCYQLLDYVQLLLTDHLNDTPAGVAIKVILPGSPLSRRVFLLFGGDKPLEAARDFFYFDKKAVYDLLTFKGVDVTPGGTFAASLTMTDLFGKTLTIAVDELNSASPSTADDVDEDVAAPKKARALRVAREERTEEEVAADKESFTSRTGFFRRAGHPITQWTLGEMSRVDRGERPVFAAAGGNVFAPERKYSVMKGRGTQPKFLYDVVNTLKAVDLEMYNSRSDFRNTAALSELTAREITSLETALQQTLHKWYAATLGYEQTCTAFKSSGNRPPCITQKEANDRFLFNCPRFIYTEPVKKAK